MELRASFMLSKCSVTELYPQLLGNNLRFINSVTPRETWTHFPALFYLFIYFEVLQLCTC
jgi:hypothetical protein